MSEPMLNMLIGLGVVGLGLLLFFPRTGLNSRWRRATRDRNRVQMEDTLKFLFDNEYKGINSSLQALAGSLQISVDKTTELVPRLEELQLINAADKNDIRLTTEGRSYALRVIRIHRIWERYLADETGMDEKDWHPEADFREHYMSSRDADRLASRMGHPVIDPHGDPIPSSSGSIPEYSGRPMNEFPSGTHARIIHIEDEPKTIYLQLLAMGLFPGMELRIIENNPEKILFECQGEERILAPLFAANITVREKQGLTQKPESNHTLRDLKRGQKARIKGISPACRKQQKRRLMDLGIVPGTEVELALESTGKDPRAYRILGSLIALRNQHAQYIFIEPFQS